MPYMTNAGRDYIHIQIYNKPKLSVILCPRCGHKPPFAHHYSVDTKRKIPELSHYLCSECGCKWWKKYNPIP